MAYIAKNKYFCISHYCCTSLLLLTRVQLNTRCVHFAFLKKHMTAPPSHHGTLHWKYAGNLAPAITRMIPEP